MLTFTFLRYERFHFDPPAFYPGINWTLIICIALNFGILASAIAIAWKLIHG